MAKTIKSVVYDGALNIWKNNTIRLVVCSAEPANFAGVAAVTLASATVSTGDMIVAAGDGGGDSRKVTFAQQTSVSITGTGTANHLAATDNTAVLHSVTTVTSQALTSGGTVTINAHKAEIATPT